MLLPKNSVPFEGLYSSRCYRILYRKKMCKEVGKKPYPKLLLFIIRFLLFPTLFFLLKIRGNCIQNFHLGRYIVGNFVLRRCASGAVKCDIRPYIRRYTSRNENFEYGYPHSNALLQSCLKMERCKPHKGVRHPTKCDIINDVKLFPTVYCRIYCRKFFMLSNQTLHYKFI